MTARPIPADTLIQVWDTGGRVHAACVGAGVLCQATEPDKAAPGVQTVSWDWGTDRVRCWDCLARMHALEVAA